MAPLTDEVKLRKFKDIAEIPRIIMHPTQVVIPG